MLTFCFGSCVWCSFVDDKATTQSSGPGFWTGAAVGGAAGYMAGRIGKLLADTLLL